MKSTSLANCFYRNFPVKWWATESASAIQDRVEDILRRKDECSVMLTRGRSAFHLYAALVRHLNFRPLSGVTFYFGDERCVPPENPESNYGMTLRTLFAGGVPAGCAVHRMVDDIDDLEAAADRYASILGQRIDVLLLGIGEDGHIVSLSPHDEAFYESIRRVVPIIGPKPPHHKLTITPPVIRDVGSVFVVAPGSCKKEVLVKADAHRRISAPCRAA